MALNNIRKRKRRDFFFFFFFQTVLSDVSLKSDFFLRILTFWKSRRTTYRSRTSSFKDSLSYSGPVIWNTIPSDVKNASNINDFT